MRSTASSRLPPTDDPFGLGFGNLGQRRFGADQHLGLVDQLLGGRSHARQAIVADANDVNLVHAHGKPLIAVVRQPKPGF